MTEHKHNHSFSMIGEVHCSATRGCTSHARSPSSISYWTAVQRYPRTEPAPRANRTSPTPHARRPRASRPGARATRAWAWSSITPHLSHVSAALHQTSIPSVSSPLIGTDHQFRCSSMLLCNFWDGAEIPLRGFNCRARGAAPGLR
jgi:hypothetical protein